MKYYKHFFADWVLRLHLMPLAEQGAFRAMADFRLTHHDRPMCLSMAEIYRVCSAFSISDRKAVRKMLAREFRIEDGAYICDWLENTVRDQIEQKRRLDQIRNGAAWDVFRKQVLERDNHACVYCHATDVQLELDHVIPRSRGGADSLENLVAACKSCNCSKGARTPEEWRG